MSTIKFFMNKRRVSSLKKFRIQFFSPSGSVVSSPAETLTANAFGKLGLQQKVLNLQVKMYKETHKHPLQQERKMAKVFFFFFLKGDIKLNY